MPKCAGLTGLATASVALLLGPLASAAEYTTRFGELRGKDHDIVAQTNRIKLCDKTTDYRFGYEIVPSQAGSYEYVTKFHLPAPVGSTHIPDVSRGGTEVTTQPIRANGRKIASYNLDKTDPTGPWSIDVYIDNVLSRTIKFDVIPADTCP